MRKAVILFVFLLISLTAVFETVFVLFFPPKVKFSYPAQGQSEAPLDSPLVFEFTKPVRRQEIKISIFPRTAGEIRFENPLVSRHFFKKLVFIPSFGLAPGTEYFLKIEGIKGFGLSKESFFFYRFKTAEDEMARENETGALDSPEITLLDIPLDWQDHPLSCEAASLKMALSGKGVKVSESEIMEEIGYDPVPHEKGVWGDPNKGFVGSLDGKMCKTGYGVHWKPVASAAFAWRPSEYFSGWKLEDLIREISRNNPVVVWGALPVENLTECSWMTLGGKEIKTFKETHVRLVVGFSGPPENPEQIILNDPLSGRLFWTVSYFLENWSVFNNSGVVVR